MKSHHFQAQNDIFFGETINIISMYLSAPFIMRNFKKILGVDAELRGHTIFRPKMAYLPKTKSFSEIPLQQFPCNSWPLSS